MTLLNKKAFIILFIPVFFLTACRIEYSFTGTTLDYNVTRTFSVENFFNDAGGGPANMGQLFTETLKEYFQRNTQLELIRSNGDLHFEGSITRYSIDPQATVSSPDPNMPDRAGQMRLSISVQVDFTNMHNDEESLSRNFSFYQDYDPRQTSSLEVEGQLIEIIFENIIQDIFTATVANW
jgi:hypothetical protein